MLSGTQGIIQNYVIANTERKKFRKVPVIRENLIESQVIVLKER